MNLATTLAHGAWLAASLPAHRAFVRALARPDEAQWRTLRDNLRRNADTAYGRKHRFAGITSYAEFAQRVPCVTYEDLAPWMDRIRSAEPNVLTRDPVTHLLPTSGTTHGRKLIPFTAGLQRAFNAAIGPWICDLVRQEPAIVAGAGYWSVTPLAAESSDTAAIPIGFDDDTRYLGATRSRIIDALMAVPSAVRHIADVETFRYVVLLHLLHRRDLRLISVWHPSFLTLLLDTLVEEWDSLLRDLATGECRRDHRVIGRLRDMLRLPRAPKRARELGAADPSQPTSMWPALRLVSCWGDGHAAGPAAALQRRLAGIRIQPKGLLATEAFVTLPFRGSYPLALNSHFFEFEDEHGALHLAGGLRIGEHYRVLVTTGGGLFRYRLGDCMQVTEFVDRTACLRFAGRTHVSDLRGEKLAEEFVVRVLRALCPDARFATLAPERTEQGWRYALHLEPGDAIVEDAHLDLALSANPNYALCRKLGQLEPARVRLIDRGGYEAYVAAETARGARLGDLKPIALTTQTPYPHA